MPRPDTFSSGSSMPTTTRATPAAMMASLQGGVRPWWTQGSRVTYNVAPLAASPAAAKALTSACGPPGAAVAPANTDPPSGPASGGTTTLPTQGLGAVV